MSADHRGPSHDGRTLGPGDGRALLLLLALAALVRLPGLGYDLWLDEIATVLGFIRLPFTELLTSYPSPNHHVLNSALTRVAVLAFGEEPWAVRLPAYLFGVATVPTLYLLARVALTRAEAFGAGVILAVSYHHAYFSQNARGYTGYIFFSVLGTWFLVRALRGEGRRHWAGYAISGALNVYVLLSGLFVVMGQAVGGLLVHVLPSSAGRRARRFRDLVQWTGVAAVLTLILYTPLLRDIINFYTTTEDQSGWKLSGALVKVFIEAALPTTNPWILGAAGLLGLPVLAAGAVRVARKLPMAYFAFLLPPVIELVVAGLLGAGSFPRRFILVMPLAVIIGVAGVHAVTHALARLLETSWKPVFAAGVVAGAVAVALPLPRLYSTPKQDFRGALAWVEAREATDDIVAAAWIAAPPARYFEPSVRSARTLEQLEAILEEGRPTWLLTTFQRDMDRFKPELAATIRDHFELRERFPGLVGGGAVLVWERLPGP